MTIKELAYSAQQHLLSSTNSSFKRAHVYELLAASFGFNSYAAFGVDAVFTELSDGDERIELQPASITRRCVELGYERNTADLASSALHSFLVERQIGVTRISSLLALLRGGFEIQNDNLEDDQSGFFDTDDSVEFGPILLDGLGAAASSGNAVAHYTLALYYAPDDDEEEYDDDNVGNRSSYWYSQSQQGRTLAGVEKEWAEAYKAHIDRTQKYTHHLREAGRLGNQDALWKLAQQFDDPSFFEQSIKDVDADPFEVAAIAESMGRTADTKHWLTIAAEKGDTEAMLQLIREHDQADLLRCWTWVYLSQLVGTDLTQDDHYAINEDGSDYDDDIGGPAYVAGRDGIDLEPLSVEQKGAAKLAAQHLFEKINQGDELRL